MTSAKTLSALEANRRFTDLKDAQARMDQARRDLEARAITAEQYAHECDVCIKIIRSCQDS